ncbi:hypothetical protein BN938_0597 [Mucinivorans hirudinis]|uniref:DUF1896 domain-containing protein n=1 Tax=Mucinivorans hirudinis TaxID=1433126 RepID=A0A060R6Q6_9BACT|nr:hypothetical protein BN938_0597 [Mucinivorans hirudinis]
MNHKNKPTEFSYYGLYLQNYLRENHPDKATDTDFITTRADQAAELYEQSRREGATPDGAQELAMAALVSGLHFSPYNTIVEVLWNEFENEVEPGYAQELALQLLPILQSAFAQYPLSDDFAHSAAYNLLYTELTGAISIITEDGI